MSWALQAFTIIKRGFMKRLFTLIPAILLASSVQAYEGSPRNQVSSFFKDLKAGDYSEAIDKLYSSNPLMSQKSQQLTMLKQQLGSISALYGSFINNENMNIEELSSSVIRIVEVAKHEHHPIIWEFYFYKPKDKWIISQGLFVDQFQTVGNKK